MSKPSEKLEAIFEAAVALETEAQRADYLNRACPDPELRRKVESLLAAHQNPDSLFAQNTMRGEPGPYEGIGTLIGRYKLLEALGEGGYGTVWLAEQREPVRRKVALKIIKLGMDSKQVVARFEAERQALALMDHTNIAKVFDAGTTDTGRPYFVMELVRGIPITKFCDENKLATRGRLDLFIKVCQAVQHAHQKGIIHRDLKPSNILITLHDGVPVPKVIDFGIAKATQQELTDKTIHTLFQQFIGTPAYVSPEQAEMSGLDIDTRSDIYSLGVLLYELLTGRTPFDGKELLASGLDEMRRTIREKEPVRPSTRLNTLAGAERTTTANRRATEPAKLEHLLRGDLDCIVMKCLEKDRVRRYDTANGLAMDLTRHLSNEPVVARPPSTVYRLRKFAKRRRGPIAAAAGIAGAIVLGGALSQIGGLAPSGSGEPGAPTRRLILDRAGNLNATAPTRDGRHLLRYNRERRGYELVEIASGRTKPLTSAGPDPQRRLFRDHNLAPDGRLIAAIHNVGAYEDRASAPAELRIFAVGGEGEGRLVFRWEPGHNVQVFGWSPNQTALWVFVIRPDQAAEIASVDVTDGSLKMLKTLAWRNHTQPPSLSPDGRFIAYHDTDSPGSPPDIFLIATDESREVRVQHPASDSKPLFAPDGSGIVFQSNRKGGGLWFLPVADGRPVGEPRAVWDDVGPYGLAMVFAENGSLVYYFATNGWEIYTADIELARGILGAPGQIQPRKGEMNNAPEFSPDGQFLAHLRDRGRRLVLRELATGIEREFPISATLNGPTIDFCPDGRALVVAGYDNQSGPVVFRVRLDRGGAERLPITAGAYTRAVCVDSDIIYVRERDPSGSSELVRRSLSTGAETKLYDGAARDLHRSPDGSRLAFAAGADSESQLLVMPSGGGSPVRISVSWAEYHGIMWLPNGRELLIARASDGEASDEASPELTFWRVPLDGGPATEVGRMRLPAYEGAIYGSGNYSIHPDGSRLAFERHTGLVAQEWAIDNLLQFIRSGATVAVPDPHR